MKKGRKRRTERAEATAPPHSERITDKPRLHPAFISEPRCRVRRAVFTARLRTRSILHTRPNTSLNTTPSSYYTFPARLLVRANISNSLASSFRSSCLRRSFPALLTVSTTSVRYQNRYLLCRFMETRFAARSRTRAVDRATTKKHARLDTAAKFSRSACPGVDPQSLLIRPRATLLIRPS